MVRSCDFYYVLQLELVHDNIVAHYVSKGLGFDLHYLHVLIDHAYVLCLDGDPYVHLPAAKVVDHFQEAVGELYILNLDVYEFYVLVGISYYPS